MKKIVLFCRVSTDRQSYGAQLEELKSFCHKDGYSDDEMIIIEGAGASAIKLNELYLDMINQIEKVIVENPTVKAVYLWALDRFGRNDGILIQMKNWFIEKKINLIIKNPYLVLLNEDGSVNNGTELTYNILATIAKQEMQMKQDRFKRSKEVNRKTGRFNGGKNPVGYIVNKDGFFEIAPDNVILKIFTLYATGDYSYDDIGKELKSQGYFDGYSKYNLRNRIHQLLNNKTFLGEVNKSGRTYPRIISDELWNKCREVSKKHNRGPNVKKRQCKTYSCKGLIKCDCGFSMVVNTTSESYVCNHCGRSINLNMMEAVVWWAVSPLYAMYNSHKNISFRDDTLNEIEQIRNKIKVSEKTKDDAEIRLDALQNKIYVEGVIPINKGEVLIKNLMDKINDIKNEISEYTIRINTMLNLIKHNDSEIKSVNVDEIFLIEDDDTRYNILHEFVEEITTKKLSRYDTEISIKMITGQTISYVMDAKKKVIKIDDKEITKDEFGYKVILKRK